jgi:hypothetical protein
MRKTETLSPKVRNETREPTLITRIKHNLGIPSHSNKTGRNKGIQIGKQVVKLYLFADDVILYLKTQKTPPEN